MAPIVAPQPRRPRPSTAMVSHQEPRVVFSDFADDPFICTDPKENSNSDVLPRLMSPIRIHSRVKRHVMSQSPTPCSSTKRPSSLFLSDSLRPLRRHRHVSRNDCPIPAPTISVFDDLPWTSALLQPPVDICAYDIADLSQLSVEHARITEGPGPIRRRRTSIRSSFPRSHSRSRSPQRCQTPPSLTSAREVTHLMEPRTPPPRFHPPSQVRFWNLMPVMTPTPGAP